VTTTAAKLLSALRAESDPVAHPQTHYRGTGGVLGVRMGDLFRVAEQHAGMPLSHVYRLLDEREYEPRMAAFCILDFQVRARGVTDHERRDRYDLYLARHDAIDAWDMVDRAAPRVIGGYLRDRPRDVLFDLAAASDPLRRRTAVTAPLFYTRPPHPDGLFDLYRIAERLVDDSDPIVAKPVGIALKHAGGVDPDGVRAFIARNGERMSASLLREARAKLPA
jgi:hypothetical protein